MDNKTGKLFLIFAKRSDYLTQLTKYLSDDGWHVRSIDDLRVLAAINDKVQSDTVCLLITEPLARDLSKKELLLIVKFTSKNGSLIIAGSGDSQKQDHRDKLNVLAAQYGIRFNDDCVIRPNPYKHYHPKEVLIEDFVVNRGLGDSLRKHIGRKKSIDDSYLKEQGVGTGPRIIYAEGCTLSVGKRSTIVMTSSKWALPSSQAICSFHRDKDGSNRVIALGSASIMEDPYIEKEDNMALIKTFIEFISNKDFAINVSDAKTIEIPESNITPDVNRLIEVPIACFQEPDPLPDDKSTLIDKKLFNIDNSMLPKLIEAYGKLNVSRGPLTLIKPEIDRLPLELEPATHGFLLRKLTREK